MVVQPVSAILYAFHLLVLMVAGLKQIPLKANAQLVHVRKGVLSFHQSFQVSMSDKVGVNYFYI